MPVDGDNCMGPLLVWIILRQHPEAVSQTAFLTEQLGRTMVFVLWRNSGAIWRPATPQSG